jgi:hypothetical protein
MEHVQKTLKNIESLVKFPILGKNLNQFEDSLFHSLRINFDIEVPSDRTTIYSIFVDKGMELISDLSNFGNSK